MATKRPVHLSLADTETGRLSARMAQIQPMDAMISRRAQYGTSRGHGVSSRTAWESSPTSPSLGRTSGMILSLPDLLALVLVLLPRTRAKERNGREVVG